MARVADRGEAIASPLTLNSTGLEWDQAAVLKRYRPLQRSGARLAFHLCYYPYFVVSVTGKAQGRWLPARAIRGVYAVDGLEGGACRLLDAPTVQDERVEAAGPAAEAPAGAAYIPGPLRLTCGQAGREQRLPGLAVFRPQVEAGAAEEAARQRALADWERALARPFRPQVKTWLTESACLAVHKPFWIVAKEEDGRVARELLDRVFAVDATTGLLGLAEFRPVLKAWASLA